MRLHRLGACAGAALFLCAAAASAQTQGPEDEPPLTFRYSFKSSMLLTRLPDDAVLFPDRGAATGFWRGRIEPTVRVVDGATIEIAFEQRLRLFPSGSAAADSAILPSGASAPFRIRQLDWRLASAANAEWRGEIDRAAVHLHLARADVTVGRQAVGWGRGVLFGAVDLFAPFTPLEADREWRRGVDAVRADVKIGDRVSLDGVGAFADRLDRSTFAARLRGYAGTADLEIMGGVRAGDRFVGATSSAAIGDFEVHGELAVFRTLATPLSAAFAAPRSIAKAVFGGSYRVPFANGVLLFGEYHYSGFAAASPDRILALLLDPAFHERYVRGDTQILCRHATALLASYEVSPELSLSNEWLQSPVDRSGVIVPTVTWTLSDHWSMVLSGYLPYGKGPVAATLQSAFGASPLSAFVQIRAYR